MSVGRMRRSSQKVPSNGMWPVTNRRRTSAMRIARQGSRTLRSTAMPIYTRGDVRINYEEAGSGFPVLLIAGGGLNSNISFFRSPSAPFNAIDALRDEYRCIAMDLRNAAGGQSWGPLEIDRPWDAYADDQLGLMSHLGCDEF